MHFEDQVKIAKLVSHNIYNHAFGVRHHPFVVSKIVSGTALPKFMWNPHGKLATKVCINGPCHMMMVAAMKHRCNNQYL